MEEIKQLEINYRYGCNRNGELFHLAPLRKVSTVVNRFGYANVNLSIGNRKCKTFQLHRLIAITFIPNPENKPCVNHINGIKTDNRVENLEWVTYSENSYHAYNTGLRYVGEHAREVARELARKSRGVLSGSSKRIINDLNGEEYVSILEAAAKNKICRVTLGSMLNGKIKNKTKMRFKYSSLSEQKIAENIKQIINE